MAALVLDTMVAGLADKLMAYISDMEKNLYKVKSIFYEFDPKRTGKASVEKVQKAFKKAFLIENDSTIEAILDANGFSAKGGTDEVEYEKRSFPIARSIVRSKARQSSSKLRSKERQAEIFCHDLCFSTSEKK